MPARYRCVIGRPITALILGTTGENRFSLEERRTTETWPPGAVACLQYYFGESYERSVDRPRYGVDPRPGRYTRTIRDRSPAWDERPIDLDPGADFDHR